VGQNLLLEIAAASRESYLAHYAAVVKRERAEHDHVVAELLIELGGPTSGMLQKLWRLDVVWGGQSNFHVVEANDRPVVIGAPLLTLPGPPSLEVFPFVWNGCDFVWPSAVQLDDDFEAWYRKWMDLEDAKPANDAGLSGVIHSVTAPGPLSGGWGVSVDFGSAPLDSFQEFLQLPGLRDRGPIRIGSFGFVEE
jgi:hypothetical protein